MRWARTPGHDAYWWWSPAFFEAIVPAAGQRTLELGCGEGREDAGFLIERLRESRPSGGVADHDRRWERVPMFLHVLAVKT